MSRAPKASAPLDAQRVEALRSMEHAGFETIKTSTAALKKALMRGDASQLQPMLANVAGVPAAVDEIPLKKPKNGFAARAGEEDSYPSADQWLPDDADFDPSLHYEVWLNRGPKGGQTCGGFWNAGDVVTRHSPLYNWSH